MDKRTYNDADTEAYPPDPDVRLPSVRREDNEEYDSRCNEAGDDGCVGAWCYEETSLLSQPIDNQHDV